MRKLLNAAGRLRPTRLRAAALADAWGIPHQTDLQTVHRLAEQHLGRCIELIPFDHPGGNLPTGWICDDPRLEAAALFHAKGTPTYEAAVKCHEYAHLFTDQVAPAPPAVVAVIERHLQTRGLRVVATRNHRERFMEAIAYELTRRAMAKPLGDEPLGFESVLSWKP